jgi:predicted DNA-binding protein
VKKGILKKGAEAMELHFPPELEAKLTHSAAQQGCNADELVREILTRHFDEEARFVEAVSLGEEALQRGEYLTHDQVGQRLHRYLRP